MISEIKQEIDQALLQNTPLTRYQAIWLNKYTAWKTASRTIYNPEKGGIKRGLQYICWDVCSKCGAMCTLNSEPTCYECMIEAEKSDRALIAARTRKQEEKAAGYDSYEFDYIA